MIVEEIAQTMIPEDNCTAQHFHVLEELKKEFKDSLIKECLEI